MWCPVQDLQPYEVTCFRNKGKLWHKIVFLCRKFVSHIIHLYNTNFPYGPYLSCFSSRSIPSDYLTLHLTLPHVFRWHSRSRHHPRPTWLFNWTHLYPSPCGLQTTLTQWLYVSIPKVQPRKCHGFLVVY